MVAPKLGKSGVNTTRSDRGPTCALLRLAVVFAVVLVVGCSAALEERRVSDNRALVRRIEAAAVDVLGKCRPFLDSFRDANDPILLIAGIQVEEELAKNDSEDRDSLTGFAVIGRGGIARMALCDLRNDQRKSGSLVFDIDSAEVHVFVVAVDRQKVSAKVLEVLDGELRPVISLDLAETEGAVNVPDVALLFDPIKVGGLVLEISESTPTVIGVWSWNGPRTAVAAESLVMETDRRITTFAPDQLGRHWNSMADWPHPIIGLSVEFEE